VLLAASAVAAALIGGVMASGSTFALWNSRQATPVAAVASGTIAITATAALTASHWGNMLPGETVRQQFTVANTGDARVAVSATATTGTASFEVRLAPGTCGTTALAGASATVAPQALGTLTTGSSTIVCLEVRLATTALPGDTSSFSVALTGTQVL
jgi:hypothetical protein